MKGGSGWWLLRLLGDMYKKELGHVSDMKGNFFRKKRARVGKAARRKMRGLGYIKDGNAHMKAGRFKEAKNCFVEALKIDSKSMAALYAIAKTYLDRGKLAPSDWKKKYFFRKGVKYVRLAIAACEGEPQLQSIRYVLAAEFFENLGEYDTALLRYETAIKLDKNVKKKYEGEIERLQNIIRMGGKKAKVEIESHVFIGNAYKKAAEVYYEGKEYAKAKECCEKAIKANPNLADELNKMLEEIEKKLERKGPKVVGEVKTPKKGPRIVEEPEWEKEVPTVKWAETDERYELLGLEPGASAREVKKAFYKIAIDRGATDYSHTDEDYEAKIKEFVRITEAKESILEELRK
jgi:tetratricopeptide (TPR) repeat protein|tara:strand:+ start:4804 stop:5850 length:1047 start_codon:yes stop_codon:yes gene_type:complete